MRTFRPGEIRVLDSTGIITRIIPFNEAERRLLIRIAVGSQRVRGGGIVSIRAFSECHLLFSFLKRA